MGFALELLFVSTKPMNKAKNSKGRAAVNENLIAAKLPAAALRD